MSEHTLPAHPQPPAEMADDVGPEPTTDATSGPASPRRISRLLALGVVVAVGLLVGAAVVAQRADAQRRTAVATRDASAAAVDAQQARADASDPRHSARQWVASTFEKDDVAPLATAQQATQLNDQASVVEQQTVAAGLAGNDHDYNAAIARGNDLADQIDAASQQLSDQVDQLPTP